jgi:hypothetical protein
MKHFILAIGACLLAVGATSTAAMSGDRTVESTESPSRAPQAVATGVVVNPTLDTEPATRPMPTGWRLDGEAAEFALDDTQRHAGRPTIRVRYEEGAPYAGIIQTLDAAALRGKTLLITVVVARDGDQTPVGAWIRAWGPAGADPKGLDYRNSYDMPVAPNRAWTTHTFTFPVPPDTEKLMLGASAWGKTGTMWIAELDAIVQ